MKKIAILGSTGSIGTQTLSVVREQGDLSVTAMSCGKNLELFEKQIREFHPALVSAGDEETAKELKTRIRDLSGIEVRSGIEGLIDVATEPSSEMLVTAIVGMLGIRPTIAAINAGKDIALANKETLVTAGHLIMPLAREKGVKILPVDSEHSAIFQSLQGEEGNRIAKILLTASGGPFRGKTKEELRQVTAKEALKHPNWSMGAKITVDSASLVNKGLEVIEAKWLFGVSPEDIVVVVQPQSIIHSMVEYEDGAVIAQLGTPDMRLPIQYALYYPKRRCLSGERLDFHRISGIYFEKPDTETFMGLPLCYDAIRRGGNIPTALNAANEYAVARFLAGEIPFLTIYEMIMLAMDSCTFHAAPTVEEILMTEAETYELLESRWK